MITTTKTLSAALTASLLATVVSAETQSHDLTGFDQISIAAGIEADIVSGPEFSVIAEARNTRVLRKLDIEVRGHTLYASRDSTLRDLIFGGNTDITLTITLPVLRDIDVSSGVDAHVSGTFGDNFTGAASSGAALEIVGLMSSSVDLSASSGANLDVTGSCAFLDIAVSSGAALGAEGLVCETVDVSSSSGASATVFASEMLESSASSGGSVRVYGSPEQTDISDSSGGGTDLRD